MTRVEAGIESPFGLDCHVYSPNPANRQIFSTTMLEYISFEAQCNVSNDDLDGWYSGTSFGPTNTYPNVWVNPAWGSFRFRLTQNGSSLTVTNGTSYDVLGTHPFSGVGTITGNQVQITVNHSGHDALWTGTLTGSQVSGTLRYPPPPPFNQFWQYLYFNFSFSRTGGG
ncbi:hypothetical protein ACFL3S_11500 [Gemmatimonadota bacterium]